MKSKYLLPQSVNLPQDILQSINRDIVASLVFKMHVPSANDLKALKMSGYDFIAVAEVMYERDNGPMAPIKAEPSTLAHTIKRAVSRERRNILERAGWVEESVDIDNCRCFVNPSRRK